jgi:hypothetical protein
MGSHKPFTESGEFIAPAKQTKICILVNAVYYFLESVFIVISEDHCRLVVIHNKKLIVDQCYETLRGAKIAFYRMYKDKGCVTAMSNEWSANYHPDSKWLEKRLKLQPQPIYQDHLIKPEVRLAENF